MQILPSISDWQDHVQAGMQYLKTAGNGLNRRAVFNNELIFQLAAMGIEKIIVGICQYYGRMPTDHSLSGLVEALESVCPLDGDLADMIRRVEQMDDMCSLRPDHRVSPADVEIEIALLAGREVVCFAKQHVPLQASATAAA
jgi:hypothetical protein